MQDGFDRFRAGMSRFAVFLVLSVCLSLSVRAATSDEPLEADQAFRPSARLVAGADTPSARHGIDVEYRIAPGYYLYRDRLRFEVLPATLLIAVPEFPAGHDMDDPFLGKTVIFRENVTIHLPFTASLVKPGLYRVRITAQGCAENRLCYAPFVQEIPLDIPPGYRALGASSRPLPPGVGR
jgi:thiol:disulfide interchange protein DsbD